MEVTSLAVQIHGGHGFIRETGVEQLMRDARITPIYEGTNGIQALDLLGRKVFGTGGKSVQMMVARIKEAIDKYGALPEVTPFAMELGKRLEQWGRLTAELGKAAMANPEEVGAAATDYLQVSGYVCLGWCWLAAAGVAAKRIAAGDAESDYLSGQAGHGAALLRPDPAAHRLSRRRGARRCRGPDEAARRALRVRMTPGAVAGGSRLAAARRVVVKIGSALLVEKSTGSVEPCLARFAGRRRRAAAQRAARKSCSSPRAPSRSARRELGLPPGPLELEESQAAAAVGQIRLAHAWKEVLETGGFTVAQVLLTLGDTEQRRRYLNARNTLTTLLRLGAIPVINENDTVATSRDPLRRQRPAGGACRADGERRLPGAAVRRRRPLHGRSDATIRAPSSSPRCAQITAEIEAMAGGSGSERRLGRHGAPRSMAAKIAVAAGCRHVSSPRSRDASARARRVGGALHLVRRAMRSPVAVRKQWIAGMLAAARRADRRRRRRACAARGQEPAARRRGARGRALRSRRCGAWCATRAASSSPAA